MVSGVPVVVGGLARALRDAMLVLLAVAVAVMAITLALVFRSRLRLLPLGIALAAAALAFGGFELLGGTLTMASIAVLPILIGLAVDYAIQFQARFDEAVAAGLRGADAAADAVARGGPAIATACLATVAGFLALQLSPTPMVRSFGLLLVAGIAIAFLLALTTGFSARASGVGEAAPRPRVASGARSRGRLGSPPFARAQDPPAGVADPASIGHPLRVSGRRSGAGGRRLGSGDPDRDRSPTSACWPRRGSGRCGT